MARIVILAIRGFIKDNCPQKASALTYYSLLSIVPVAAMAFGIAKGFGFEKNLRTELENKFSGQEEVVSWIMDFADKYLLSIKGGMIAGIGFAVLLWSVMNVLGNIEQSFNEIWEVKKSRSFIRKFSDYVSFMLVGILFLVSSSSMVVFVSNKGTNIELYRFASSFIGMILPYLLIWIVFTFLIVIMPNTRVKLSSALIGGIIAGTLFQVVQYSYIHFQIGMSRYNAVYGSFAAFPLFLIWLQISWLIVLFGAELSFASQNVKNFEFESDTRNISYSYKRQVTLLLARIIIQRFINGEKAPGAESLSFDLKLPIRLVKDVLYELTEAGVICEIQGDDEKDTAYHPGKDINELSISMVIQMVENRGSADFHFEDSDELNILRNVLNRFDDIIAKMPENCLLKDI
ncbi:YihY/virulence factor BrkB family protein [Marinilabiliaceae bacterium JC017]|nr:YihY/virulence factor BrkB family protein [Marinilabiliaceae bacterium JC017]